MFELVAAHLSKFLTLNDLELQSFASFLKPRRFSRKESVIEPGAAGSFDLFIETGCLRIYSVTLDGFDRNLHFGTEDSWWCHTVMPMPLSPLVVGIDTLENTELLMVDSESKERLCVTFPTFDRLFRLLAQRSLTALQERLVVSLQNTAEARYREFTRFYPNLEARIPNYHIASYLGICPEFFSKLRKKCQSS